MNWSRDLPGVRGYWWWRKGGDPVVVRVTFDAKDQPLAIFEDDDERGAVLCREVRGEWAGPIDPPVG